MVKSPARSLRAETGANQVVSDFVEILESVTALIEEFVLEAAELAETLHGRRFERDDDGAGDSEQWAAQAIEHRRRQYARGLCASRRAEAAGTRVPALGVAPPPLAKPATAKVPRISGTFLVMAETCSPIFRV